MMLVSIVMPTYNCGLYIEQSIQSVMHQTMKDWELIIIDDGSTDNTPAIVTSYAKKDSRISYVRLDQQNGPAMARTQAIQKAQGKYIAFLDSDDLWLPEKLEKQLAFMEQTGVKFSATAYSWIDENGKMLNRICIPPKKTNYNKMFYMSDPIGNSTVIYNQEVLGKYEVPSIRKRNDYALWLKMLHDVDYCYGMPEVYTQYRIRNGSVSRNKIKLIRYQWYLYRKLEDMSLIKSSIGILCWGLVKSLKIGTYKQPLL